MDVAETASSVQTHPEVELPTGHVLAVLWTPTHYHRNLATVVKSLRERYCLRIILRIYHHDQLAMGKLAWDAELPIHAILDRDIIGEDEALISWLANCVKVELGREDGDRLALALSDAVLDLDKFSVSVDNCLDQFVTRAQQVVKRAAQLGKLVITHDLGGSTKLNRSDELVGVSGLMGRLDPEQAWLKPHFLICRVGNAFNEAFALRRQPDRGNPGASGYQTSLRTLRRYLTGNWKIRSHFAPESDAEPDGDWRSLCPDIAQRTETALSRSFEEFDRGATFGAALHRGIIWLAHLLAAFAVLFAVCGKLSKTESILNWCGLGELGVLGSIWTLIFLARKHHLQSRWMAHRFAAEQLRIARLCIPLLVVPSVLLSQDGDLKPGIDKEAWQAERAVKRIVRDHGLPRLREHPAFQRNAKWLALIVEDQRKYHEGNVDMLEHVEQRLHGLANCTFFLALCAVIVELAGPEFPQRFLPPGLGLMQHPTALATTTVILLLFLFILGRSLSSMIFLTGIGGLMLVALWSQHALLLATTFGPALAAALHGIDNRLAVGHRIAESRQAVDGLEDVLKGIPDPTGHPVSVSYLRSLALKAADAMETETRGWYRLLTRQQDILP